ncbi:MAG: hypothetical protein FJ215_05550 [Ignavibacteria bacterium]|nr:hypothetical protein [Ignavibacteria bacterium]
MFLPPTRATSLVLFLLFASTTLLSQPRDLKSQAMTAFVEEDYARAIELIRLAITSNPNNAENYYYLGHFLHQECVDAVPNPDCGRARSDEIIRHMEEAIARNPGLTDSYFYLGLEHGVRAREELFSGNPTGALEQLRIARAKNGLPDWLIEYGKNVLRSCEQSSILFTSGDAEANAIFYAQAIDRVRTDVTVIPIPLLNHPDFLLQLKRGIRDYLVPAPMSWGEQQILAGRPYRWKTRNITVPGMAGQILTYPVTSDITMESRTYLSLAKSAIIDIIRTNRWRRSIHFSLAAPVWSYNDLTRSLEIFGLTLRFVPVAGSGQGFAVNVGPTEHVLLDALNFAYLPTLRDRNFAQASILLNGYRDVFLQLIQTHMTNGRNAEARRALDAMDRHVPNDVLPMADVWMEFVSGLRQRLRE